MSTDLMLDLETLGTRPGCAVLSIGAVRFDRDGAGWPADAEHEFYCVVSLESCLSAGLTVDAGTVAWWMERPDMWPSKGQAAVDLDVALAALYRFASPEGMRIWCHGATFDVPILAAACAAIKWPICWDYRLVRDTRTLFDEADLKFRTVAHNALEDARAQALAVQEARRRLRSRAA